MITLKKQLFTLVAAFALFSCNDTSSNRGVANAEMEEQTGTIKLVNKLDMPRPNEPLSITTANLEALVGATPPGMVPCLKNEAGEWVPSQVDDLDGDGYWDEISFVMDFEANASKMITVEFIKPGEAPEFEQQTNIRLGKKEPGSNEFTELVREVRPPDHTKASPTANYQMEGPAWENDKVAFRLYFDPRNSRDIFGKVSGKMVLDSVGISGDYHEMQDWGMDILKVGNSLGAGGVAMVNADTLVRLGKVENMEFQLVTEGPVRATMRLSYLGWQVGGNTFNVQEEITIWKGQDWYSSKIMLSEFTGEATLATGIVNLQSDSMVMERYEPGYVAIASHDQQSYKNEYLGMAILASAESYAGHGQTSEANPQNDITETWYIKLKTANSQPVSYRFYAGWEVADQNFNNPQYFLDMLQKEARRLNSPVEMVKMEEES